MHYVHDENWHILNENWREIQITKLRIVALVAIQYVPYAKLFNMILKIDVLRVLSMGGDKTTLMYFKL